MQLFNIINSRKIFENEYNIFTGILRSPLFLIVVLIAFTIQMCMVEVLGKSVKCMSMDISQIGICIAFGSGELIWGLVLKFIPLKLFQCYGFDESVLEDEDSGKSMASVLKKSSTMQRPSGNERRKKEEAAGKK